MDSRIPGVLEMSDEPGRIGDIDRIWQNTRKWSGGKNWIAGAGEERKG
jgi:hypothetical protein